MPRHAISEARGSQISVNNTRLLNQKFLPLLYLNDLVETIRDMEDPNQRTYFGLYGVLSNQLVNVNWSLLTNTTSQVSLVG
jgi:hypothetical protein